MVILNGFLVANDPTISKEDLGVNLTWKTKSFDCHQFRAVRSLLNQTTSCLYTKFLSTKL